MSEYRKGDKIRVTSGPNKGATGTVIADQNGNANVAVSLPWDEAHNVVRGRHDTGDSKRVAIWDQNLKRD
jgi:hypothetical protein